MPRYAHPFHTMENHRMHLVIPTKTRDQLQEIAERKHLTYSALCRQALMDLVEKENAK